jgi:eukaryotic-like serine/threonine-protein kinase
MPDFAPAQSRLLEDPFTGTRYRALSKLASGSRGELYVVEHVELGKRFAAKLLRPELSQDARVVERMRIEAQSLGRLRHPNVVAVTGFDRSAQGLPFIVMELLNGCTLADELATRNALPWAEAIDFGTQVLSALEAVHQIGVIHRDVSPKNLFLHQSAAGQRRLKLIDFGAARVQDGCSERAPSPLAVPTATGAILGSASFTSPEAAQGQPIDPRSDIYQVGLVLYLMLTGQVPVDTREQPEPPSRWCSGELRSDVDELVLRALAKDPEDRFPSAAEFLHRLTECYASLQRPRLSSAPTAVVDAEIAATVPTAVSVADYGATGPLRRGDRLLEQYQVTQLLGLGGHAYVYECRDQFLDELVAVKVIPNPPNHGRDLLDRARAEAQLLRRLSHPNVVRVHTAAALGEEMVCLVMEKLEGVTLRHLLALLGRLSFVEASAIVRQIAIGVAAAHQLNVVHRDIKPDNVYVLPPNNHVKVLDFGIAKFLGHGLQTSNKHRFRGTPLYMSPEHLKGAGVTVRSDVYQLGTVLFELLTGVNPNLVDLDNPGFEQVALVQMTRPTPALTQFIQDVPPQIDWLVQKATAKDAEARFATMNEFVDALDRTISEYLSTHPTEASRIRTVDESLMRAAKDLAAREAAETSDAQLGKTPSIHPLPPSEGDTRRPSAKPTPCRTVVPNASSDRMRSISPWFVLAALGFGAAMSALIFWLMSSDRAGGARAVSGPIDPQPVPTTDEQTVATPALPVATATGTERRRPASGMPTLADDSGARVLVTKADATERAATTSAPPTPLLPRSTGRNKPASGSERRRILTGVLDK